MAILCIIFVLLAFFGDIFGYNYYSGKDVEAGNKLLLILIDGVRWDYPDQNIHELPGFRKLMQNGVRAPYLTPIFPANSYPNWYTIVTGLYAESHGFVQNMMFDSIYGDFFLMAPNDTVDVAHWWQHAEPLWITAEKNGIRSALYWWDGCQVEIRGKRPTFCRKYRDIWKPWPDLKKDYKEALLTSLDLFTNDEIRLVQIYYEPIDYTGHKFGPDSDERKAALLEIDDLLNMLQEEMEKRDLIDKVNIVAVSDHGMTSTDTKRLIVIDLEQYIDVSDIRYMVYYGSTSMLLPYGGKIEKVYDALQHIPGLRVYKKEDIPEHYHIKNSYLTLPLLLVASKGYSIRGLDIPGKSIPTGSSISLGSHGYDPYEVPDMRGIFFARGPKLRKNYISPSLQMVDVYNILCSLLDMQPLPNNGTQSINNEISVSKPYTSDCEGRQYSTLFAFYCFLSTVLLGKFAGNTT